MQKNSPILILVLLALVGVGGWFFFGSGGATTVVTPPAPSVAPEGTGSTMEASASTADTAAPAPVAGRTAVVVADDRPDLDPELIAAMSRLVGRVVDFEKAPAPNKLVRLFRADPTAILTPTMGFEHPPLRNLDMFVLGEVRTDALGRFEFTGVPPRSLYLFKADVDGDNPTMHFAARTPGPGATTDVGDIVLKNGAILVGTVVDESGDPLPGATVRALDVPGMVTQAVPIEQFDPKGWLIVTEDAMPAVVTMPPWVEQALKELPIPSTTSDAEGRFRLAGVQPGSNIVAATKDGHLGQVLPSVKLDPGQERDVGRLALKEGEIANGRVLDGAGKPVEGAEVIIGSKLAVAPVAFARSAGKTDARGQFECAGFAAGEVIAAARRSARDPWFVVAAQPIQRDIVITLPARFALTVRVVSEVGAPIREPSFRLVAAPMGVDAAAPMSLFGLATTVDLSERQGRNENGSYVLRDLDAGRYALIVSAAEHAWAIVEANVTGDVAVEARLTPQVGVDVLVVDQAREPIRGATIYATMRGEDAREFPVNCGPTNKLGQRKITRLSKGSAVVEAVHPRYGSVAIKTEVPSNEQVVLTLAEPGAIEGVVTTDGKPPVLGQHMVQITRPWDENRVNGPTAEMPMLAAIDAEGRFKVHGLQPGRWRVAVENSIDGLGSFSDIAGMMMGGRMMGWQDRPESTVDVASGTTAQVTLETNQPRQIEGPSGRIAGTVMIDGVPAEGATIGGWKGRYYSVKVDAGGRFDLGEVPVGNVHLQLLEKSGANEDGPFGGGIWSKMVEVKEGEAVEVNVAVMTGAFGGVVRQPDGLPAQGVRVHAYRTDGEGSQANASTDRDGRFDFTRVAAGKYAVQAQHQKLGRGFAEVTVAAGARGADLEVQLARVFNVSGRVDRTTLPKSADADDDWIYLSFEATGRTAAARRGSSGDSVGKDDTFSVEGLLPGQYRVRVHVNRGANLEHDELITVLDRDVTGIVIRPVEVKPKPKPEKAPGK